MNYHNITVDDMLNGDGLRTVLWVSGCDHRCRGCQNPQTWPEESGIPFDDAAREELFEALSRDYMNGITFSGGDPLFCPNRRTVGELIMEIRERLPEKTIWLYTGSLFEEIKSIPFIRLVDVVVDGPYIESLRDTQLHWKGSKNQRVIDVKRTFEEGRVVLWA
ncbi:MAG: anaerobic ribonucleoside-triphosphate reductase activating protein [Clostridia bacterium]|nr:anaerobic ribonucleoside-triphosphate reductase activating protein [Clostridia bacterium]MBQ6859925.1 anaerobic ribonucleoside-triphosphate reductase activating protein [Clostridia bacterium]MBQ7052125.1 anaerobic ribonucleoside-triphosphate reductase activating protein [Clostridia bacterium]